jgi:hypothetical protein
MASAFITRRAVRDPRSENIGRPLKASVDKEKNIPLPPIVGVLALAGGVVLVIVGARKS